MSSFLYVFIIFKYIKHAPRIHYGDRTIRGEHVGGRL